MNFEGQSQFTRGRQKEIAFEFTLCLVVVRWREERGKGKRKERVEKIKEMKEFPSFPLVYKEKRKEVYVFLPLYPYLSLTFFSHFFMI